MPSYSDVVHGLITDLSALERDFIDHPAVLQLMKKKQLALAHRVFSSAVHTRYEHSIGVLILAGKVADVLRLRAADKRLLQCAAVLHDIGHYPFSHTTESVLRIHHEEIPQIVLRGEDFGAIAAKPLLTTLRKHRVSPRAVARVLAGTHRLSPLISGKVIDVDRLDYVPRDLNRCGLPVGVDLAKIVKELRFAKGVLGITRSGVASLEHFLACRLFAWNRIYLNPDAQAVDAMIRAAIRLDERFATPDRATHERIHRMADTELLDRLAESPNPRVASLARAAQRGPARWHRPVLVLGGVEDLSRVRALYARREAFERVCDEAGLLCSWFRTGAVLAAHAPKQRLPSFPVAGGTQLYAESPVSKAIALGVPYQLLALYAPAGARGAHAKAQRILSRFLRRS